jgi:hypothetical protein
MKGKKVGAMGENRQFRVSWNYGKLVPPGASSSIFHPSPLRRYRPSVIELGKPFSQPCGAFQGLTALLAVSSVLAQPLVPSAISTTRRNKNDKIEKDFMIPDERA